MAIIAWPAQEVHIPTDIYSLVVIGVVGVVAVWLLFFLVRKLIALALIAAVVVGAWMLWNDPSFLGAILPP